MKKVKTSRFINSSNLTLRGVFSLLLIFSTLTISAQDITTQINQLEAVVSSLPDTTDGELVKKAVLELALERAANAVAVSYTSEAEDLVNDVLNAIYQPANQFIQRNPNPEHLSILYPLLTETNNPYLDHMVSSATSAIAISDVPWPRTTDSLSTYTGLGGATGTRSGPALAQDYFWLFAHDQSPMRFNPELIKRALRRMHAFADLVNINSRVNLSLAHNRWIDQFAVEYAFPAFYEIAELHPNLLLPSQRKSWDNMMKAARAKLFTGSSSFGFPYNYNQELARMLGLLNIGFYLDDQEIIDRVLDYTDKAMSKLLQDGDMPYHGNDRPSTNYHNVVSGTWINIYEQTQYEPILQTLTRSQWKGPTAGRTDEFWTSPFDKAYRWNRQKGAEAGYEAIATITENPYVRWMLDRNQALTGVVSGKLYGRDNAIWYRPDISSLALPDNYTIPDKNIGGPRAWYGNFTYAAGFSGEEGHETLMGAMTVDPDDGQLNSILADVTPRIWVTPTDENGYSAWANITQNGEISATTISKNYSIGTSVHGISRRRNGAYDGPVTDWKGRQMWIGLPDRIIGLVSVVPNVDNAKAYAINGAIRLISGGSIGAKTLKVLETISPNHYRYGQLDIIIHDNTYTSLTDNLVPYRNAGLPATELIFSNRTTEPLPAGTQDNFPINTEFRFAVEIRAAWADASEIDSISVLGNKDIIGLEAVGANRSFQVWLNTTDTALPCTPQRNRLPSGNDSFVLSDGILGRVAYDSAIPAQVNLEKGQHALIVVSADAQDHDYGEASFSSMMNYSDIIVSKENDFKRVPLNTEKEITFSITNPNDPILTLTGSPKVEIEGDAAFTLIQDANMTNLNYGDSATFKIKFSPTAEQKYSAIVKINSNAAGNETYQFKITGEGSDEIILIQNSAIGTAWENPNVWEDGQPAQAGNKYLVNRSENGAGTLRTPTSYNAIFPGESLRLIGNGGLLLKGPNNGIISVNKLTANHGYMLIGTNAANYNWVGDVVLEESGLGIGSNSGGSINFQGVLSGNGTISTGYAEVTFNNGTWNGDIILTGGLIRLGFDVTQGGVFIHTGGTFDINNRNHIFENLIVNGIQKEAGVYTSADLGPDFIGNGTITISPYTTAVCIDANFEEIVVENTFIKCTDRIDNDGDGLTDCDDPDCAVFNLLDSDGDGYCDNSDICPNIDDDLDGSPCDDRNLCTINDRYVDCECIGSDLVDENNDGICDYIECEDVYASNENTNLSEFTLDEDLSTYWSSTSGEFIEYCLGDIKTLTSLDIAFYEGDIKSLDFNVEVSLDGVNYTSLICDASSSGSTLDFQSFTFLPIAAKKVKITFYAGSLDPNIEITEVRINTAIFLEAEDAPIVAEWEVESDSSASNSEYVIMDNIVLDSSPTESDALVYNFTIDKAGDYKIWARKITPDGNSDSFWIKLDNGNWEVWGGSYTAIWQWFPILGNTYTLTEGNHTLYIQYRESEAKLDKICISSSHQNAPEETTQVLANTNGIYMEAECADIAADWSLLNDIEASNGEYVMLANGPISNPDISSALAYNFTIDSPGDYHIWMRRIASGGASDSFWIKLNDGRWEIYGGNYTGIWNWYKIFNRVYSLSAGTHTLYVHYREAGTKFDKLYISSTNSCAPSETEGAAINCGSYCSPGTLCDDGDICTLNDVYDLNCNCAGTFWDTDYDGVCDFSDICPGFDDNQSQDSDSDGLCDFIDQCPNFDNNLIGSPCDDGNACTVNDTYISTCHCIGEFDIDDMICPEDQILSGYLNAHAPLPDFKNYILFEDSCKHFMDVQLPQITQHPAPGTVILQDTIVTLTANSQFSAMSQSCSFMVTVSDTCEAVTANTHYSNHLEGNTLDNNLNTYWGAPNNGDYLEFCFGKLETIHSIDIAFFEGDTKSMAFEVEVSVDGLNWISLLCNQSSNGTSTDFQSFTFQPIEAYKVRIIGYGNSIDDWNEISEVRIHKDLFFEAEDAVIVGDWEIVYDAATSGQAYVNSEVNNFSPTLENALKYEFYIDEQANYNVMLRTLITNGSENSFWLKVDDGNWLDWQTWFSADWHWREALTGHVLTEGMHTLYIHYRESNASLDQVLITETTTLPASGLNDIIPNSNGIYLEAECALPEGDIGDWEIINDNEASSDFYLTNNISNNWGPDELGTLEFDFNILQESNYTIWLRIITPSGSDNSFWVKLDEGDWQNWSTSFHLDWTWKSQNEYALSVGAHKLYINYRENGAKLDKIYIADTHGCSPEGIEGSAVNCSSSCPPGYSCNDGHISGVYDANCNCLKRQNVLYVKLLLEGFYEEKTQQMHGQLKEQNLLPLTQPFNTAPWNYTGTESVTTIPENVTDWILVTSRDKAGNPLSQSVGFISHEGMLVSLDGTPGIEVDQIDGNHFSIHHRSHLAVMSSQVYTGQLYDFTTSDNRAKGIKQLKAQGAKYLLYAGDYDCNGIINNSDFNYWKINGAAILQYLSIDGDGNGIINNKDYNLWINNRSKVGESVIRY